MSVHILSNTDLVESILLHLELDLDAFVRMGWVCMAWREVCRSSPALLVGVAARSKLRPFPIYDQLFALSRKEAYDLAKIHQEPGVKTTASIFESVLIQTGGMAGWQDRLTKRARAQASIERTYGPDWREIREAFRRRMM